MKVNFIVFAIFPLLPQHIPLTVSVAEWDFPFPFFFVFLTFNYDKECKIDRVTEWQAQITK